MTTPPRARELQPSAAQRALAALCGALLAAALLTLSAGNAIGALQATGSAPAPVAQTSDS